MERLLLENAEVMVYVTALPPLIKALCTKRMDEYVVCVSDKLSKNEALRELAHECCHIMNGDLDCLDPVKEIEGRICEKQLQRYCQTIQRQLSLGDAV